MSELWVVGSLNLDIVVEADRFPLPGETVEGTRSSESFGGKGGNQAVALARLGARPFMVGAVGDDRAGGEYLRTLELEGVRAAGVERLSSGGTGTALIEVSGRENRIVVVPGANGLLTPSMVARALGGLGPGDIVLLQLEIPIDAVREALLAARGAGAASILDPAPARVLPREILALADFVTPNETEAAVLAGGDPGKAAGGDPLANARILRQMGCRAVVQKAGRRGAYLLSEGTEAFAPAFAADVVDTIGAGDAFNAGFAYALSRGLPSVEALRWGNAAGALSTRAAGAQGGMPRREELEALLG